MNKIPGQSFLVGGAVRDHLLGLPVHDRDFVVVGATPEQMLSAGFRQVGKDFPVFLCPEHSEEYALARAERKVAPGYHGFEVDAGTHVTLEEDLARRDLTINAIAQSPDGALVDPYGGAADLANGVLRHVSPAFAEDPVRILRTARFMARYADQGFVVAPETMDLMRQMVQAGEVDHLVPERVWAEFSKACKETRPSLFLDTLRECGALDRILPEVDALYGIPQVELHHPEIDTGIHTGMVLDMAVRLAPGDTEVAFAALTHDLGKGLTPEDILPRHPGHEKSGLAPLGELIKRWKVPTEHGALARLVCELHLAVHQTFEVRPGTLLKLLDTVDAWRKPQRWENFLLACEADKRGRLGLQETDYPQGQHLREIFRVARQVKAAPFVEKGLTGIELGQALRHERLRVIHQCHSAVRKPTPPAKPRAMR